jgi:hypothetical protein
MQSISLYYVETAENKYAEKLERHIWARWEEGRASGEVASGEVATITRCEKKTGKLTKKRRQAWRRINEIGCK